MNRTLLGAVLPLVPAVALAVAVGCKNSATRPAVEPPPPDLRPTTLDYADGEAFDGLFESALLNQDPAIVVRTTHTKPDWDGRLNAWIAAWNLGGKVDGRGRVSRGQTPLPKVDGETLREFRLLIDDLMGRVEGLARGGAAWWAEDRIRSRRVALLKPYNLRFHVCEERHIHLIFFNGNYARHYPAVMQMVTGLEADGPEGWSRTFECSHCRQGQADRRPVGRLTSGGAGE
jgi:hypothetical protein